MWPVNKSKELKFSFFQGTNFSIYETEKVQKINMKVDINDAVMDKKDRVIFAHKSGHIQIMDG